MHNLSINFELNLWSQVFPEFTIDDYVFVLPPTNILGDSYIAMGYIDSFEKYRRKKVFIAASVNLSAHKKITDLHTGMLGKLRFLDKKSFEIITEIYCNGPYIVYTDINNKRFFANQLASIVHPGFGSDAINWIQKGISVYDLYKIHLNLNSNVIFENHLNTDLQNLSALELFNKLNFKIKKTVIIFPDTHSIKWNNIQFIDDLANILIANDYDIIVDSNNTINFPNFNTIKLELGLIVPFMNLCGFSIILRSGMADVTNGSISRRVILYPSNSDKVTFKLPSARGNVIELVHGDGNDCINSVLDFFNN